MKKVPMKKSVEKKLSKKPRLTKEEREAKKQKLKEEREAKKAARLAKREAKKQKEAEKKAAAKAKREERKAKKLARLQKQKERKAALKLKAKERAEKKAARLAKKADLVRKPRGKKADVKKVSVQEKIEAERNEWKALSAIRRYVKNNAKTLEELDGDKLARKIKKLQKMGYTIDVENGTPLSIGYDFEICVKIKVAKPAGEKKPRKPKAVKIEDAGDQQPQDSTVEPDVELATDAEILAAAAAENAGAEGEEILAGDTFKDEDELAAEIAEVPSSEEVDDDEDALEDEDDDEPEDADEDEDDDPDDGDPSFGAGGEISSEQEAYRREAFRDMEANGTWD